MTVYKVTSEGRNINPAPTKITTKKRALQLAHNYLMLTKKTVSITRNNEQPVTISYADFAELCNMPNNKDA